MRRLEKITMLMLGLLCGCSHKSVTKDVLTPDYLLAQGLRQITFQGDNEHPRFSPDGIKLLYSSRSRVAHKGAQIYEMDLTKNKERRVTFSDGDAFDPSYVSDDEILYASTTDEIKESPFINKTYDKDFPPSDLYMSDRFGGDIERLTQQPGFDGEGLFVQQPKDSFILFTSKRAELLGIYRLETKHAVISFLAASADKDRRSPTISPDHKQIAFIEKDKKTQEQSLQLYNLKTRKTEVMKSGEGLYRDLIFAPRSPDRVFYSVLRKGEKQYQIEMYDLAEKCTQVVFKGTDSLTSPVLSDDSIEKLAFARSFQEKKQIYIAPLPQNLGPCLENSKPVVK